VSAGRSRARMACAAPSAVAAANTPDTAAAARVLRQFRLVFNAVKTHFQQVEKQAGIGGAQVWALSVLRDAPGIGVTELAQRMDIHQSTASNLVRSLARAGLVRIERNAPDRRMVQLHLQPSALPVLDKAPGPLAGVLPEALARLDPGLLARLEADLAALLAVLQTEADDARIPLAVMSQNHSVNANDSY